MEDHVEGLYPYLVVQTVISAVEWPDCTIWILGQSQAGLIGGRGRSSRAGAADVLINKFLIELQIPATWDKPFRRLAHVWA